MNKSTHGHKILAMVQETEPPFSTREALFAAVQKRFGKEALFHTCSYPDMSAESILAFMFEREKIILTDKGLATSKVHICDN